MIHQSVSLCFLLLLTGGLLLFPRNQAVYWIVVQATKEVNRSIPANDLLAMAASDDTKLSKLGDLAASLEEICLTTCTEVATRLLRFLGSPFALNLTRLYDMCANSTRKYV